MFQTLQASVLVWAIYCCVIGLLFGVIKVVNYKLHHLFDTGEAEEENPSVAAGGSGDNGGQG